MNLETLGYSIKMRGTTYHIKVSGITCAIYFGKLLRTKKSSKVVTVLLLKALKASIINFLRTMSSRKVIIARIKQFINTFKNTARSWLIPISIKYS
tara:strand:- start:151690 stop:151977 length:288 start_codon:yes stop_codon:yes gene_type:complete